MKQIILVLRIFLLVLVGVYHISSPAMADRMMAIAAVVNNDAISVSDVDARMDLVLGSSGLPNTEEIRERMRPRIINSLIEEQLKLQEAEKLEISVPDEEVKEGFATIAKQNGYEPDVFRSLIEKEGISIVSMERQIRSQMAWTKVITQKLRPQVQITDKEVDSVLERFQSSVGKTEYLVAEIFLPVDEAKEEQEAKALADRLTRQLLEAQIPFQRLARQFSQSASASRGGDLGWIQEGQLPEAQDKTLSSMNKGDLSQPVRSLTGFHIFFVRDKREIKEENIPSRFQVENDLGTERLDRLQRRYLLELKTAAFIEHRV